MLSTDSSNHGVALITGASAGIGAVYADRLARRGHDLILVARNRERLDALAQRLERETGRSVDVLPADLNNRSDLLRVETRLRTDPRIAVLVNNAGLGATAPMLDSNPDALEAMIQLNVIALTRLSRAVVSGFVERGTGTIINISSIVALSPELLNGSYSGSKAYVVNLTQSMSRELSSRGLRLQAVLPGAIRTDFWETAGLPLVHLPEEILMTAEDLVDAALAGLDLGEVVTIPSLPNLADWQRLESTRLALAPNLSHVNPASRYGAGYAASGAR